MSDQLEPRGPPVRAFTGAAGTANLRKGRGGGSSPGYEVWFKGQVVGWFQSLAEAEVVARKVAEHGFDDPEAPDDDEDLTPGPRI